MTINEFIGTTPWGDYVFEGIWKNFNNSAFGKWVWTLKDRNAFLVLSCLTLLVAWTQARSWVLLRYLIFQRIKPVRLPCSGRSDPMETMSQGEAISDRLLATAEIFREWRKSLMGSKDQPNDAGQDIRGANPNHTYISPWFGAFAVVNLCLYLFLSASLPWFLTEGALEAPIVRSKASTDCLTASPDPAFLSSGHIVPDAIFKECRNELDSACVNQRYLRLPKVEKLRVPQCPFPEDICLDTVLPVQLTQTDITAFDVGVNSNLPVTFNRRITCAPISIDRYLFHPRPYPNRTILSIFNPRSVPKPDLTSKLDKTIWSHIIAALSNFSLQTANGPGSGRRLALANARGTKELHMLPVPTDDITLGYFFTNGEPIQSSFSPRYPNGTHFMITYKAGNTRYKKKIDDAFFAAHELVNDGNYSNGSIYYVPDREMTALGCVEQQQYCLEETCSLWSYKNRIQAWLANLTHDQENTPLYGDTYFLYWAMPRALSVYFYLGGLIVNDVGPTGLYNLLRHPRDRYPEIDSQEQWILEVETWFRKSFLAGTLFFQNGVRFPLVVHNFTVAEGLREKHSLCGRILFRHGDYTNIHFMGLLTTIVLLASVCLCSCSPQMTANSCAMMYSCMSRCVCSAYKYSCVTRDALASLASRSRFETTIKDFVRFRMLRRRKTMTNNERSETGPRGSERRAWPNEGIDLSIASES